MGRLSNLWDRILWGSAGAPASPSPDAHERKESAAASIVVANSVGQTQYPDWDWRKAAIEAYGQCYAVYAAIERKAKDLASIPIVVTVDGEVVDDHPAAKLLSQPNEYQSEIQFRKAWHTWDNIAGNVFTESVGANADSVTEPPRYLYVHPSHELKVVPGDTGVAKYELTAGGKKVRMWPVEQLTGDQAKLFPGRQRSNLLQTARTSVATTDGNRWYGQSPLYPAARAVDFLNAVYQWNTSLLENGGRCDGILSVDGGEGYDFEEVTAAVRASYEAYMSGPKNAGRMMTFPSKVNFTAMGVSPKDIDWQKGKDSASRDIALDLGVPPQLLGIPGDSTFNNMREARESYWDSTVIPECQSFVDAMNGWLAPLYGEGVQFKMVLDNVPALAQRRMEQAKERDELSFMTINEKRKPSGLDELDGDVYDTPLVPSGMVPADMLDTVVTGNEADQAVERMSRDLQREGYDKKTAERIARLGAY